MIVYTPYKYLYQKIDKKKCFVLDYTDCLLTIKIFTKNIYRDTELRSELLLLLVSSSLHLK